MNGDTVGGEAAGPGDLSAMWTQPLQLILPQLERKFQRSVGDLQEFVDMMYSGILEMPEDERFRSSIDVLESNVEQEFGDVELLEQLLPIDKDLGINIVSSTFDYFIAKIGEDALQQETSVAGGRMVLIALIFEMNQLVSAFSEQLSQEEKRWIGSSMIALFSRLIEESKRDNRGKEPRFAAISGDVVRAGKIRAEIEGIPSSEILEIEELNERERINSCVRYGAVVTYEYLDISIGKGAELAQTHRSDFEEILREMGQRPNYGPRDLEEWQTGLQALNG